MALTLEHVTVRRGGRTILNDVSVAFQPGRVTVILGPNGAGKSTLLEAAAGLCSVSGRVLLDGQDLAQMPATERARAIGYLPQDSAVHWDMTVEEVVALGRLPYRDRNAAAIARAMTQTDTQQFADRRIGTLSGGERSRVMLARVMAGEPAWILADEPFASLDPAHAFAMLNSFLNMADTGMGVVLIMHDLSQAVQYAGQIIVMEASRVVANNPVDLLDRQIIDQVFNIRTKNIKTNGKTFLVLVE